RKAGRQARADDTRERTPRANEARPSGRLLPDSRTDRAAQAPVALLILSSSVGCPLSCVFRWTGEKLEPFSARGTCAGASGVGRAARRVRKPVRGGAGPHVERHRREPAEMGRPGAAVRAAAARD